MIGKKTVFTFAALAVMLTAAPGVNAAGFGTFGLGNLFSFPFFNNLAGFGGFGNFGLGGLSDTSFTTNRMVHESTSSVPTGFSISRVPVTPGAAE